MFISKPFNRKILSSSALEWSASCPGFAGGSLRGSLSTMISKSISFVVKVDISFSKQKEYSPGVFPVKTKSPVRSRVPSSRTASFGSLTSKSISKEPPD